MKRLYFSFVVALSLGLTACTQQPTTEPMADTESKPLVITSFYPLYFFANEIAGEHAEVINLAGASDPHDYSPTPQQLAQLNSADLVVYLGAEMEPWTDDVIPQLEAEGVATVKVSEYLPLYRLADENGHKDHDEHEDQDHHEDEADHDGDDLKELTDGDGHSDAEHDEEDHESEKHEDEHDDDHHHHGEFDPHVWLDPILAQKMGDAIIAALARTDIAHVREYEANAGRLRVRLDALDARYSEGLSTCERTEAIVSHDAFGYLARRYAFELHPIAGISTMDEPSAKVLAELSELAEEDGITHILSEATAVQRFAQMLATETGLAVLQVNPLGAGPLDPEDDYFDVMQANLLSLRTALGCS